MRKHFKKISEYPIFRLILQRFLTFPPKIVETPPYFKLPYIEYDQKSI
ncbi:MAG: hypothetical protein RL329_4000 [Bacteroidota bacterium]|jgi:hypothetical protein